MSDNFVYDDGGRSRYFKGEAGDCAVRALSILTGEDYKKIYTSFNPHNVIGMSPRSGVLSLQLTDTYRKFDLVRIDIYHEASEDLFLDIMKTFDFIVEYPNHMQAVISGTVHDTHMDIEFYEAKAIWCMDKDKETIEEILENWFY